MLCAFGGRRSPSVSYMLPYPKEKCKLEKGVCGSNRGKFLDNAELLLYCLGMKRIKDKKRKHGLLRVLFILAGGLLTADTVFVMTRSSINLGVVMPAILGAPLLLIGLFMPLHVKACEKSRLFRAAAFMLSLCYLLFGLLFAATTLTIKVSSEPPEDGYDALIVLGGGIRGRHPTLTLKYRLDTAAESLERNPDAICVVSGGQGPDEIETEAAVMKAYLVGLGIDPERIFEEDKSQSTEENFAFSKRIIEERLGEGAVTVFVTTDFHVFRAERTAARAGIDAQGIPAKGVWYLWPNDRLRECAAITAYFLTGKM